VKSNNQGMAMKLISTLILTLLLVAGCASKPKDIVGYYVSPYKYRDFSCEDIALEALALNNRFLASYDKTEREADVDSAQLALGLTLFWPALFFLDENNLESQSYSLMKGQMRALVVVSENKNCNVKFLQEGVDYED
jgi:hypothetical protein|tara:strand:+ start:360 stop:770 length:411 start_codon:yes stop_codon:yes gene_type:complete